MAMGLQYNTVSNLNLKTIFYFVTITLNKFYINKNVIMKTPILIYQMLKKLIIKVIGAFSLRGVTNMVKSLRISLKLNR